MKKWSLMLLLSFCVAMMAQAQFKVDYDGKIYVGDSISYLNYGLNIGAVKSMRWTVDGLDEKMSIDMGDVVGDPQDPYNPSYTTSVQIAFSPNDLELYNAHTNRNDTVVARSYNLLDESAGNYSLSSVSGLDNILDISPYKTENKVFSERKSAVMSSQAVLPNTSTISFNVEDLKKAFPALVRKNTSGEAFINMQRLIPYLVSAYQTLSLQEKDLESQIDSLKTPIFKAPKAFIAGVEPVNGEACYLHNNVPNPFSSVTSFSMYIPSSKSSATIRIANSNGQVFYEKKIIERGAYSMNINGTDWMKGIYFCSLIVDGDIVNTIKLCKK